MKGFSDEYISDNAVRSVPLRVVQHGDAMRLIAGWCAGCLVLNCLVGCAFIKPVTEVMFNPATGEMVVRDSKDNSLDIKGLKVLKNPDGTFSLELEQGTFANQSSTVIEANVQQMLAFVE